MSAVARISAIGFSPADWRAGGVWRQRIPGIAVAALLAFAAEALAAGLGDPWARNPVLVAMLCGLAVGIVFGCPETLQPGLQFTTRILLRLAIALVGLRITWRLLVDVGLAPIAIAVAELALMFVFTWLVARRVFKLEREFSLMLAAGCSICGAAAILATASLIKAKPRDSAIAVTTITLFGTIALFVYPYAFLEGLLPGLDDEWYGVFVGASIYELAQVYGAAASVSDLSLGTATLIKLIKVLMLIPMLLLLRIVWRRMTSGEATGAIPFPWYIVAFVALATFNSMVTLSGPVRAAILRFDVFLFMMVMVALGLNTRAERIGESLRPIRVIAASTIVLAFAATLTFALVQIGMLAQGRDGLGLLNGGTGAPARLADATARDGALLFRSIGCDKCHVPSLRAGDREWRLYSDLLLHDMGPGLDDKIVQGEAEGRDWRTAPLVGLGLRTRYLHDGRATTLRDAIIAHGGEAQIVRDRYLATAERDQELLLRFLQGL
jgi:uncharacterized integral membrane protein (TIGR00698 family)